MIRYLRAFAALCVVVGLAACNQAPSQPDVQPPPKKPYDAKTQLEYGK